uniref:Small integral membrane protein 26 n=1 Tax=Stegastes partitus TaxID=144197 RepID=A0A3B5AH09_9TELE
MKTKDAEKLKVFFSAVYAFGVWTTIGSLLYLRYMGRFEDIRDNPYRVVYETAHTKTVIVYKKDFVPYTTRLFNFFNSFTGNK